MTPPASRPGTTEFSAHLNQIQPLAREAYLNLQLIRCIGAGLPTGVIGHRPGSVDLSPAQLEIPDPTGESNEFVDTTSGFTPHDVLSLRRSRPADDEVLVFHSNGDGIMRYMDVHACPTRTYTLTRTLSALIVATEAIPDNFLA
jgi:hypothetical protein